MMLHGKENIALKARYPMSGFVHLPTLVMSAVIGHNLKWFVGSSVL
jgi:hypothetical protein